MNTWEILLLRHLDTLSPEKGIHGPGYYPCAWPRATIPQYLWRTWRLPKNVSYSVVILQGKQATHFILLPSPNHQSVSVFYRFCVFLSLTQSLRQSTDSAIRTSVSSYTCPGWFGLASEAVSVISYEDSASNLASGPPAGTSIFLGIPYFSQPSGSPAPYSKP